MIDPLILLSGICTFLASLVIHIIIWRIIRPVKHIIWLGAIFLILPTFIYILLFYLAYIASPSDIVFTLLWHLVLSSAYIMSYPLMQAEAPSLKIILVVSTSMPEGIMAESINNIFSENILLNDRINDLVNDRLILLKNGKCIVTRRGRILSAIFSLYRRLLGLRLGTG